MGSAPVILAIFALSLASFYIAFVLVMRSVRIRRAKAEELAIAARLTYVDGEAALRSSYEEAGALASWEMLMKLPAFIRAFLAASAPWRLEGERDGARVEAFEETRSSGKNSKTVIVVRALYPKPLLFKLRAGREGTLAKIGKALFGLADVEVGDGAFDGAVRVAADDKDVARALFSRQEARTALLALLMRFPEATAGSEWVERERTGRMPDAAELEEVLDLLVAAAKAIGT